MEAVGSELWISLLWGVVLASNAVLLIVQWRRGTRLSCLVGLVVGEAVLCWLLPTGNLAVPLALLSAICGVMLSARGEEDLMPVHGRAVLITGCDSGFGHELAKTLDRLGIRVYAGVLDEFGPGAQELKRLSSSQLTVLQLDVTDSSQISAAHQLLKGQLGETGLWGLVNNAGILGYMCDGELLPMRIIRKILDVNFIAGVEVTKAFLPLIRRAKGRIITVCSMAGAVPFPGFAAYVASKAAAIGYYGTLRLELSCWGVKVTIIQPAGFRTNILGNQDAWSETQKEILSTQPQEVKEAYGEDYICSMKLRLNSMSARNSADVTPVLEAITHALLSERPQHFYYPGETAWFLPFLFRICPTWLFDALFLRMLNYNKFQPAGATLNK